MSSIEKLLIRGVRSFDPKHEEVVAFYTPLTLIVGHNGSGKTVGALRARRGTPDRRATAVPADHHRGPEIHYNRRPTAQQQRWCLYQ